MTRYSLALRPEDVDLDQMTLRVVGKGNKQRMVPMSQEGRKRMFIHLRGHHGQFVFETGVGTKLLVRNFLRDFKKLCKGSGIEGVRASPHTLRHSFAVHYLRNGGNLEFLRRILGHSSILTTAKISAQFGHRGLAGGTRSIVDAFGKTINRASIIAVRASSRCSGGAY